MEKTFAERVCRVLEGLTLLEWTPENKKLEDLVYRFCHLVPGTCKHEDWMQEFLETEKLVYEATKSPAQKRITKQANEQILAALKSISDLGDGSWVVCADVYLKFNLPAKAEEIAAAVNILNGIDVGDCLQVRLPVN